MHRNYQRNTKFFLNMIFTIAIHIQFNTSTLITQERVAINLVCTKSCRKLTFDMSMIQRLALAHSFCSLFPATIRCTYFYNRIYRTCFQAMFAFIQHFIAHKYTMTRIIRYKYEGCIRIRLKQLIFFPPKGECLSTKLLH